MLRKGRRKEERCKMKVEKSSVISSCLMGILFLGAGILTEPVLSVIGLLITERLPWQEFRKAAAGNIMRWIPEKKTKKNRKSLLKKLKSD